MGNAESSTGQPGDRPRRKSSSLNPYPEPQPYYPSAPPMDDYPPVDYKRDVVTSSSNRNYKPAATSGSSADRPSRPTRKTSGYYGSHTDGTWVDPNSFPKVRFADGTFPNEFSLKDYGIRLLYDGRPTFQLRKKFLFDSSRHMIKLGADLNLLRGTLNTIIKVQPTKESDSVVFPSFGLYGAPVPDVFLIGFRVFTDKNAYVRLSAGWNLTSKVPVLRFDIRTKQRLRPRLGGRSLATPSPAGIEYDMHLKLHAASIVKLTISADLPPSGNIVGDSPEPLCVSVHNVRIKQYIQHNPFPAMMKTLNSWFRPARLESEPVSGNQDRLDPYGRRRSPPSISRTASY